MEYGGSGGRGALLRKELWAYPTTGVVSLLSEDDVSDGNNSEAGQTRYSYDIGSLTSTTGLPQHSGAIGGQRGNLTSTTTYYATGGTLSSSATYEDTGNVLTSTAPNGVSTYTYEPSTHAFAIVATPPTPSSNVSLPSSATYDLNTGVVLNSTDLTGQQTVYKSFDSMLRNLLNFC